MNISRFIKYISVSGLLAMSCLWVEANAQGTAAQEAKLDEVIVTAEKREENLQKLGISVTAFDSEMLNALGSRDIQELSNFVPNLQIGAETSDLKIMIRGVGSDNLEAFSDPGVAVHIDGVYQARPSGGNYLYYDMQRVEVLRGPQGTLYGRNANGGAINFISNQPTDEFEAGLDVGTGDESWQRVRGMINIPIAGDKLMLRAVATAEEQDGYQENLISSGTVGNDKDDSTVRAQLLWQPSDNASFLLSTSALKKDSVGPVRKRTSSPGMSDLAPDGTPANCQDCGYVANPDDLRTVFKNTPEEFVLDSDGSSLTFDYDFGSSVLTFIGAYQSTEMNLIQDSDQSPTANGIPGGTTDTAMVAQDSDQETFEIRLASAGDGGLEWLIGAYFLDESAFQNTIINRDPTIGAEANINVLHDVDAQSSAFFGQLSFDISDSVKLTGGVRVTEDEKDATGGTIVRITPPFGAPPPPSGAHDFTPKDSWSSTTWKVGFDWETSDDHMLYGSVSTGYKAGGFNFGITGAESYDPEEVTAFEFGSKNRFSNDRVQFNATAFYYDYRDLQVFQVVNQTIVVRNAAEAEIYGAELELVALAGDSVQFDASFGLLETEYKDFILPSNLFLNPPPAPPGPPGPPGPPPPTPMPTDIDVSGNTLINAPSWSGHIGLQYTFGSDSIGEITARVQGYFSDDVYLRALNLSPYDIQESYSTWDAKLMWRSPQDRWYAEAFYNNLGDEDVITNLEVTDSGIYFANLNRPQRWGIVVGVHF
jgi:iron complex outermembrane receptor protein